MKFTNEADKILNETKTYTNEIYKYVERFKVFCEDIANDNAYTTEEKDYKHIHTYLNDIVNILAKIKDKYFNLKQCYDDKRRPSVLYPYEKQVIYQYINKFDFKKNCHKKCGCMYAEKIIKDGKEIVTIGLSICNDKDEFSKNIALNLAKKRAREYPTRYDIRVTPRSEKYPRNYTLRIPFKWMYEGELAKFVKRCTKWFKNETIIYPNNIDFVEFPKKRKNKSNKITDKKMPF